LNHNNDAINHEIQNAMADLFSGAKRFTETRIHNWLDKIAQVAFREGANYARLSLLTIQDIAREFSITTRRARAIAKHRHEKFGVGQQLPGGQWVFSPDDLDILRPDPKYRTGQ